MTQQLLDLDEDDRVLNDDKIELITRRRRQLLVHSHLYYEHNETLIDDYQYDRWATELIRLQKDYPEESKVAPFYDDFKEFTMGASFQLPYNEAWVMDVADRLLKFKKKMG